MRYTNLGNSGLIVSRLSFGSMTFGDGEGPVGSVYKVDAKGADTLVGQALDAGINFFNSADVYAHGRSEEMLGKALRKRRRDVVIATKVGNRIAGGSLLDSGLSRRHIIASAERSLKRLGTDWIDVYLTHRFDPDTPVEETLAAFDHLVSSGKVRQIGYSNWPAWTVAKAAAIQQARGYEPFRAAEVYYSLVGRDIEVDTVPTARDAGIGLMIWSPLAGGFLSGKYKREDPKGGGNDRLAGFDILPFDRERGFQVVDALRDIAGAHHASPAQVAIAWVLSKGVASVIVGASRPDQLADNLGAIDLALDGDEIARLDASYPPPVFYPNWLNDGILADRVAQEALAAK